MRPSWLGAGTACVAAALFANLAWSQIAPPLPPAPAAPEALNTAESAAQGATNAAQDATKSATDTAQDAARTATGTAQDAARTATGTAQDAARTATGTAQDAARTATGTAQDAARDAQRSVNDATRAGRDAAQDIRSQGRGAAQDTRDAARDASRAGRNQAQDLRNQAQDIGRDARGTAQDVRDTARDATNNTNIRANTQLNAQSSQSFSTSGSMRSADLGLWFDRSVSNGLVIADVAADAALGRFGFREGDRIVSVMGQPVLSEADFVRVVTNTTIRDRIPVIVMRDNAQQTIFVEPGFLSQSTTVQSDSLEQFGIILDDRVTDRVVIWRVLPRSAAFYAGLRAGDVITTFGGQPVNAGADLIQIVQTSNQGMVPIQVSRNGRVRQLEADFGDVQVSERRTSFRQDLDANATAQPQNANPPANINIDVNTRGDIDQPSPAPAPAPSYGAVETREVVPASPRYIPPARRGVLPRRWRW